MCSTDLIPDLCDIEAVGYYKGDYALEYELHYPGPEEGLKKFYDNYIALFEIQ